MFICILIVNWKNTNVMKECKKKKKNYKRNCSLKVIQRQHIEEKSTWPLLINTWNKFD